MSSLGPVQATCPYTSAMTGKIRDSHMPHSPLGFPAEDGLCRIEPASDQQLQHTAFLQSFRSHRYQATAHLDHKDSCHPASHPPLGLWLGPSWWLGSCLYQGIWQNAGPSASPDPVLGGGVHTLLPGCQYCLKPSMGYEAGNLLQQWCGPGYLQCELVTQRFPFW